MVEEKKNQIRKKSFNMKVDKYYKKEGEKESSKWMRGKEEKRKIVFITKKFC